MYIIYIYIYVFDYTYNTYSRREREKDWGSENLLGSTKTDEVNDGGAQEANQIRHGRRSK